MFDQENEKPVHEEMGSNELNQNPDQGGELLDKTTVKSVEPEHEQEYSPAEYNEMVKLYEDTINDFVEGEVIIGKILAIGEKEVTIDIGFKSEGTIPIDEFNTVDEIKVGSDIEVYLDNIEDKEGQLILSKRKADFMRTWDDVMRKYESGEILQGRCVRRIKGGIVVDINTIDAFLPGSQIDVKPIRDFDAYIGKTMDFKIVKVNNLRKNIVVSHRVLLEEKLVDRRKKILDELYKGQILEGAVKNITDFGVFIDLGGADGLLHINDLSWGRVNHPSEIVALDERINVIVLDFNEDKDRISLGLKQLQPHPWENVEKKYPAGSVVKGKVVNISDYGAFVELEKGVEGLIHISEMSWTQHIKHPSKILAVGESVEAKILNVDVENKKISLGLKQLEPDPWDLLEEKYPVSSRHKGKVRNLTNFGAFVELEEGIDGLIHISDLSWTKKIRHPAEVVKKGEMIDVIVLNVDRENRRISLGYKQVHDSPWEQFTDKYMVGTVVKGKIVRLIEKGIIAEINEEVDGFVPFSHLAKPNISKPSDGYKVGDEVELCILEFDKESKKIVCSEKIDHALSLIKQRRDSGKPIVEEVLDDEFSLETYPDKAVKAAVESKASSISVEVAKEAEPETPKEEMTPSVEVTAGEAKAEESAGDAENIVTVKPKAKAKAKTAKQEESEADDQEVAEKPKKKSTRSKAKEDSAKSE